jgi:putative hemolysin
MAMIQHATPELIAPTPTNSQPRYSVEIVSPGPEAELALRLRYRVFAEELGAQLAGVAGRDIDEWDQHCRHLLVRDTHSGDVVGTYRILLPETAIGLGHSYSAAEFDLRNIEAIRASTVEVGRSCVDPAHRNGAVVNLLWAGLAALMLDRGYRYLAGCCSLYLNDGADAMARVVRDAMTNHAAPAKFAVYPKTPWDYAERGQEAPAPRPALLSAYLRLGAWVCGPPALDADFGCADLYILLDIDRVNRRILDRLGKSR